MYAEVYSAYTALHRYKQRLEVSQPIINDSHVFLVALAYIDKEPSGRYSCFKVVASARLVALWLGTVIEKECSKMWFTVSIHQVNIWVLFVNVYFSDRIPANSLVTVSP